MIKCDRRVTKVDRVGPMLRERHPQVGEDKQDLKEQQFANKVRIDKGELEILRKA